MSKVTFITGGARSGKSTYGLKRAASYERKTFVATAVAFDAEMKKRIDKHREERDTAFVTVEEPLKLAEAITSNAGLADVILIDCLTVWLCNVMHEKADSEIDLLMDALKEPACDLIIVSNELGMGVVPENALAREFRDIMGFVNQRVAALADEMYFMVSGQPMTVKQPIS